MNKLIYISSFKE